jgi:hypothetical protein
MPCPWWRYRNLDIGFAETLIFLASFYLSLHKNKRRQSSSRARVSLHTSLCSQQKLCSSHMWLFVFNCLMYVALHYISINILQLTIQFLLNDESKVLWRRCLLNWHMIFSKLGLAKGTQRFGSWLCFRHPWPEIDLNKSNNNNNNNSLVLYFVFCFIYFLAYFPYFEKMKVGLCDLLLSVCLWIPPPPLTFEWLKKSLWNLVCISWHPTPSQRRTS